MHHKIEIDAYLQEVEQQATQIRQQIESNYNQAAIRERLLARQNANDLELLIKASLANEWEGKILHLPL